MNITDIRIRKINNTSNMKAIISVTLNEEIVIHDVKVIEGEKGLFIAMPSRKISSGEFKDIVHPINSSARQVLQDAILEEYSKVISSEFYELDNNFNSNLESNLEQEPENQEKIIINI